MNNGMTSPPPSQRNGSGATPPPHNVSPQSLSRATSPHQGPNGASPTSSMPRQRSDDVYLQRQSTYPSIEIPAAKQSSKNFADKAMPTVHPVDWFRLDPWEKFVLYRRIPLKLVLNITLIALLSAYIFVIEGRRNQYDMNNRLALINMFFSENSNVATPPGETIIPNPRKQFRSIDELVDFVGVINERYYDVVNSSTGVFMHYVKSLEDPTPIPPVMAFGLRDVSYRMNWNSKRIGVRTYAVDLTNDVPTGPFANVSAYATRGSERNCTVTHSSRGDAFIPCRFNPIGDFVDRLTALVITLKLRSVRVDPPYTFTVVRWVLEFDFDIATHAAVIDMNVRLRAQETNQPLQLSINLASAILVIVLWDLLLRIRTVIRYYVYVSAVLPFVGVGGASACGGHPHQDATDEVDQQFKGYSVGWSVFAIFTDFMCLAFVILAYIASYMPMTDEALHQWKSLTLGFACAFYCVNLISYLQQAPRFYILMKTLSRALPDLILYFVGVLPLFVGYAVLGCAVFGGMCVEFSTFSYSLVTLFIIMNGDSLLQMFTTIDQSEYYMLRFVGRFYEASFLFLFICIILNIALCIVQDNYTNIKECFMICQMEVDKSNARLGGRAWKNKRMSLRGGPPGSGEGDADAATVLSKRDVLQMIERIQDALPREGKFQ